MPSLNIRHVPEEIMRRVAHTAALKDKSIHDWVLELLMRESELERPVKFAEDAQEPA